jgi:hypothetical protein
MHSAGQKKEVVIRKQPSPLRGEEMGEETKMEQAAQWFPEARKPERKRTRAANHEQRGVPKGQCTRTDEPKTKWGHRM